MDITFDVREEETFESMIERFNAIVQEYFMKVANHKGFKIEKLSFVNYAEKTIYPTFPVNKKLSIYNFSSFDTFGFGKYEGSFFDFIVIYHNGKPMNHRVFYSMEDEINDNIASENTPQEDQVDTDNGDKDNGDNTTGTEAIPSEDHDPTTHMFILGEYRKYHKKGRATYIEYNDSQITLTEARKLESSAKKIETV